jgi:AraC family transcriptional regulator
MTRICAPSAVAVDSSGVPMLTLPPHWRGIPLNVYPLPHCEERGPSYVEYPMLFLVLDGYSQRRYRYNTNVLNLETKPGGIELKERDYQREWASWKGTPGLTVGVHFVPQAVNRLVKGELEFDLTTTYEFLDPKIQWLVRELLSEAQRGALDGTLYAESLSCALIAYLSRTHGRRKHLPGIAGALSLSHRQRIVDYIETRLGDDVSIADMARELGISPDYFARSFTATFGIPPHRYVLQCRIEAAKRMIHSTSNSIADIAADLGFYSHAHFARIFRQLTGMTPKSARTKR